MKVSASDYRLIGFGIVAFAVIAVLSTTLLLRPKTSFEREHARAEAANPEWIRVEISTADKRNQYREDEPIYIVARFSSTARYQYKIEIAEGQSPAAVDFLHISNGTTVPRNLVGIFCCFSRLVGLDDEPYSPKTITPLRFPPGSYEIYLTSRRIFTWETAPGEYVPSQIKVASNMLKIRVVAAR